METIKKIKGEGRANKNSSLSGEAEARENGEGILSILIAKGEVEPLMGRRH